MSDKLRAAAKAAYDYITREGKVYSAYLEQALDDALAEPEQEPVGKFSKFSDGVWKEVTASSPGIFLYAAPPRREWVPLTEDDKTEIKKLVTYDQFETAGEYANRVQAATEFKLKDKNA